MPGPLLLLLGPAIVKATSAIAGFVVTLTTLQSACGAVRELRDQAAREARDAARPVVEGFVGQNRLAN